MAGIRGDTVTVYPPPGTTVYWADHPIKISNDRFGGAARLNAHRPDSAQLRWLRDVAGGRPPFVLVDVGANVGLFSRQALIALSNIARVYAYEPDATNYENMAHNLAPWAGRVSQFGFALARDSGVFKLYLDHENCGNYSLLRSAMAGDPFSTEPVVTLRADVESRRWARPGWPILYKSDAQGYDELIATLIEPATWDAVFAAVFEIWRIQKPDFDVGAFRDVLARFPHRKLLQTNRSVTVDEAIEYLSGRDGQWQDLAVSK
jgi:FkbM family methyltransferase